MYDEEVLAKSQASCVRLFDICLPTIIVLDPLTYYLSPGLNLKTLCP